MMVMARGGTGAVGAVVSAMDAAVRRGVGWGLYMRCTFVFSVSWAASGRRRTGRGSSHGAKGRGGAGNAHAVNRSAHADGVTEHDWLLEPSIVRCQTLPKCHGKLPRGDTASMSALHKASSA